MRGVRTSGLALAVLLAAPAVRAEAPVAAEQRSPALARELHVALAVTDAPAALERIRSETEKLGGHLVQGNVTQVVVAVPAGRYRTLFERLGRIGDRLPGHRLTTTDLTDAMSAARARLRAARESRRRLVGIWRVARLVPDHLELGRALERAQNAEADARREISELEARVATARIVIRLQAPEAETIPETRLPFPWLRKLSLPRLVDTSGPRERKLRLSESDDGGLFLSGGYTPDDSRFDGASRFVALGASVRMLGDPDPVAPFGGLDLSLGGGGGFIYGLQLMGGLGTAIGKRVVIALSAGPGIDGITSTIPFGVDLPLETYVSLDLFKWMAATVQVRDGWVLGPHARRHGSRVAPFGDEASAALTLAIGPESDGTRTYSQNRAALLVGFAARQTMGATIYFVNLGFGVHESNFSERY